MIIEFLGVSGVGKSTVAKQYKKKLEEEGKTVCWESETIYNNIWLIRNMRKSITVIIFSLFHLRWIIKYWKYLKNEIKDIKDYYKPLFNGVYLKKQLVGKKNDDNIYIFDEGPLHYLWAIKMRSKTDCRNEDINMIEELFGLTHELIYVHASPQEIYERLQRRKEYTRIMDNEDIISSIIHMSDICKQIIELCRNKMKVEFFENSNTSDLKCESIQ